MFLSIDGSTDTEEVPQALTALLRKRRQDPQAQFLLMLNSDFKWEKTSEGDLIRSDLPRHLHYYAIISSTRNPVEEALRSDKQRVDDKYLGAGTMVKTRTTKPHVSRQGNEVKVCLKAPKALKAGKLELSFGLESARNTLGYDRPDDEQDNPQFVRHVIGPPNRNASLSAASQRRDRAEAWRRALHFDSSSVLCFMYYDLLKKLSESLLRHLEYSVKTTR